LPVLEVRLAPHAVSFLAPVHPPRQ
jgi:hypothetical protein